MLKSKIAGRVVTGTLVAALVIAGLEIRGLEGNMLRWKKLAQTNNKIVHRFIDLAPPEISEQIQKEFEFERVTLDF